MGKRNFLQIFLVVCLGVFLNYQLPAQLVVNPNVTSTQLMNNMIAQGLTVSNVQLNCTQGAYGTFNGSASNLGIANGILLTTGNVSLATGPNNSANIGANNQIQFSDPQLTGLVSNATYDPCVLEFDVIPNCDSLEIRFVFGSEEYMEFVNRSFNDAFGFFITGPNPLGGNFNNTNIAWIPGTSTPVSVQNVNLNTNSSWYFDNGNGTGNGTATDGLTVQFDGFTKVMTVKIRLTPCASYHFKIAIADAGDHVVDSGVFIDYIGCGNLLSVNPSSANSTSCITCNGTASVAVSGGNAPYTYLWSTGATTLNATGLCPGTYSVTIKDNNVCSNVAVQTFTIGGGNNLTFVSTSETDIACGATCSGVATVSVTGGTPNYTYQWLPSGGNTRTASNLCVGNYTVTVTDSQGCTLKQSFGITQNTITATQGQTDQGCNPNCVGAASIIVTQGTWPYSYSWSNGSGNWPGAFNLCAGVYTCTVTDAEGCRTTKTYTITNLPPIVFTKSQTDINCNSVCNGAATMNVTGGTPNFTYSWYPGAQTTSSISSLCAGYYSVHVTDGNGCSVDEYYYVSNGTALYLSPSQTDASCSGACDGTATVTPQGGSPGYTFSWAPSGATTATATGLCAGNYTCTVRDAGGCTEKYIFYIYQAYPPNVYVNTTGAACNGTCNGTATANAYNGSGNYSYSWSSSAATTATITGLCTGNYTVTITDPASGCTAYSAFSITQAQPPNVYVYTTDAACNGTCTGTATSNVFGGAQPYQYSWSPAGGTNANASGYCIGNFTLTVTDAGGCTVNYPFAINQAQPPYVYPQQTDVSCHGGCDATANVQVYNGVAPYQYQWLPSGGTNASATGLCVGTYSCSITDAIGCNIVQVFNIVQAPAITTNPYQQNPSCGGVCDAYASVFVQGGIPQYTYSWSNNSALSSIFSVCAGLYTLTVTDAAGCTAIQTFTLTDPVPITINMNKSNISCNGLTDGVITASVTGGTGFYYYYWSTNEYTQSVSNLAVGTYTVTVYDSNNCSKTDTATIIDPPTLLAGGSSTPVSCIAATGTATGFAIGGTPTFSYLWSNGSTRVTISGLNAGIYSVTVTDSRGCKNSNAINVINSGGPRAYIVGFTDPLCSNSSDGTATASAVGGLPPYTYLWNNSQSNATASGLTAGSYTVFVTDIFGCGSTDTVRLSQPSPILANANATPATCGTNNGTASASAPSGGTPGYFYLWSNTQTTSSISGLATGVYSVTVSDAHGCPVTSTVTVTNSNGPNIVFNTTTVSCYGGANGIITASVIGGPYTYAWSNTQTTSSISSLTAGLYSLTVTDVGGCSSAASTIITEPAIMSNTLTVLEDTCGVSKGSINVNVSGGVGAYNFLWNNGQTTSVITGLNASVYSVTITDANNCTSLSTGTVVVANILILNYSVMDPSCAGGSNGSATIMPTGFIGPYSYLWGNGQTSVTISSLVAGVYNATVSLGTCIVSGAAVLIDPSPLSHTLTISDASCGQADGGVSIYTTGGLSPYSYTWNANNNGLATITGLNAGVYTATVSDSKGCTSVATSTVNNTSGPTINFGSTNVSCNGGANGVITTTVTGANPFTYSWSNTQTTSSVSSLAANTYSLTVTDAGGCTATGSVIISEPSAISNTVTANDANCGSANGDATVNVNGGVGPYNYLWSNTQTTSLATGLVAAQYSVTITDANSCTVVANATVNNTNGPLIAFSQTDVSCNGIANGIITTTVGGGGGSYNYLWSNTETTANISSLLAGPYSLTVTDGGGCTTTANMAITEPAVIGNTLTAVDETCGLGNGSITTNINGGTSPYNFVWSNTQTNSSITGLSAAVYSLTITDANSCSSIFSSTVNSSSGPGIVFNSTNVSCNGGTNGIITTTVNGAGPFNYLWSNTQTTANASALTAGSYTVTVTDASGCSSVASATITEPSPMSITITPVDANCGLSDGSASSIVNGGNGPYIYSWSTGSTLSSASLLSAGGYTLTVTDNNSCSTFSTTVVSNANGPILNISNQQDALCNGSNNGSAHITTSNGSQPYSFLWNNNQTDSIATNLSAGIYTLTVTDAGGCTNMINVNITEPITLVLGINTTNASCGNTGTATANVNGGTVGYNYLWSNTSTDNSISNLAQGIYSLTVSDANGCSTVNTGTVNTSGGLTLNPIAQNVVCNNDANGIAGVNASGGSGSYSYSWNTAQTDAAISGLTAGGYTVQVTDAGGCSGSLVVNITEPNAITIVTSGTVTICNGQNATLTAIANGGNNGFTYQWNPGALLGAAINVNTTTSNSYIVTVTDANGCTAMDSALVVVNDPPQINFSANDTAGCEPLCITLNHTVVNVNSLTWYFGDGDSSSQTSPAHCYTQAGIYNLQLTVQDNNGCNSSLTKNNYITVYANPVAAFSATPQEASVLDPLIQLADQSQGANSWLWNFGDENSGTSTLQNVNYIYGDTGSFEISLIVTSLEGCMDTAFTTISILPDYILYVPNSFTPNGDGVNDFFFPKGMGIGANNYHFYIFDRWGAKIFESDNFTKGWDGKSKGEPAQIDVYVWKIDAEDQFGKPHQYTGHVSLIR